MDGSDHLHPYGLTSKQERGAKGLFGRAGSTRGARPRRATCRTERKGGFRVLSVRHCYRRSCWCSPC